MTATREFADSDLMQEKTCPLHRESASQGIDDCSAGANHRCSTAIFLRPQADIQIMTGAGTKLRIARDVTDGRFRQKPTSGGFGPA
ncbi:hypothetical protein [Sphingobium sp. YC-XJ3]|uniref:hypothetical protein n=1 Tax=Sphingobium sp. YC-XJ3 TaxID=3024245 RepID=UPI00236270FC|nr:hypothetical protein [Sphingobium sp. YC-XJ3]WDA39219.1 hypothetical protein PO876_02190 [Sphingobium sp. YC-XJ3]